LYFILTIFYLILIQYELDFNSVSRNIPQKTKNIAIWKETRIWGVFFVYMKLYHCEISCTTSMTAGMATTALDGSNNIDITMRCWRHFAADDLCWRKNVQAKYQTAKTLWTYCTNSLTMVTSPVYIWEIPAAQELTIFYVWWAKRRN
jgi:hypothetical protein